MQIFMAITGTLQAVNFLLLIPVEKRVVSWAVYLSIVSVLFMLWCLGLVCLVNDSGFPLPGRGYHESQYYAVFMVSAFCIHVYVAFVSFKAYFSQQGG